MFKAYGYIKKADDKRICLVRFQFCKIKVIKKIIIIPEIVLVAENISYGIRTPGFESQLQ